MSGAVTVPVFEVVAGWIDRAREQLELLVRQVADGGLDPARPVFRADLED